MNPNAVDQADTPRDRAQYIRFLRQRALAAARKARLPGGSFEGIQRQEEAELVAAGLTVAEARLLANEAGDVELASFGLASLETRCAALQARPATDPDRASWARSSQPERR